MTLIHSLGLPLGTAAPSFLLPDVNGRLHSLGTFAEAQALVVVFTCNHCPYAVAIEDRLIALHASFAGRSVDFVLINPNDPVQYPEDSLPNMVQRAKEKAYPFPYLIDPTQEVAHAYRAVCTPDIFLFDRNRRLFYAGRFDDNWQEPAKVTREDLRIAIEDLLAERELSFVPIPSMGCSIKWRKKEE